MDAINDWSERKIAPMGLGTVAQDMFQHSGNLAARILRGRQEKFNYLHSSLRNIFELTFGMWKKLEGKSTKGSWMEDALRQDSCRLDVLNAAISRVEIQIEAGIPLVPYQEARGPAKEVLVEKGQSPKPFDSHTIRNSLSSYDLKILRERYEILPSLDEEEEEKGENDLVSKPQLKKARVEDFVLKLETFKDKGKEVPKKRKALTRANGIVKIFNCLNHFSSPFFYKHWCKVQIGIKKLIAVEKVLDKERKRAYTNQRFRDSKRALVFGYNEFKKNILNDHSEMVLSIKSISLLVRCMIEVKRCSIDRLLQNARKLMRSNKEHEGKLLRIWIVKLGSLKNLADIMNGELLIVLFTTEDSTNGRFSYSQHPHRLRQHDDILALDLVEDVFLGGIKKSKWSEKWCPQALRLVVWGSAIWVFSPLLTGAYFSYELSKKL
ncbi:hypothetical protein RJ639_019341 [Escallonia herrerae]|uniref:Uncharacterized protein n=1 Tax=Escallonia herrerae TaxID=1293975 RepID=A0AA88VAH9_9ASTE|nr:hypothetical protein RJ639_019341 [Escallonia herrerae]